MASYHKSPTSTRSAFLIVFILITLISLSYILFGHSTGNLSRLFSYAPKPTDTPSLGTSFQTFFHDALNPSDPDYQSLLSQARQIIAIDGSNGFLRLREEGEEQAVSYGVSMFHQLHCVEMLRAALRGKGRQGGVKARRGLQAPPHQLEEGEMSAEEHLEHCLDYITQGIMCSADDTIEPSFTGKLRTGEEVTVIDGVGAGHYCRKVEGLHDILVRSQEEPAVARRPVRKGDTLRSLLDI